MIDNLPEYVKLNNAYNPAHYPANKKISAEEWNALWLSVIHQGNHQENVLASILNITIPENISNINNLITVTDSHTPLLAGLRSDVNSNTANIQGLKDGTYPIDSCANVSETINDILITDIFESNGITAKSSTNAKNDALGNDIPETYQTKANLLTSYGIIPTTHKQYPSAKLVLDTIYELLDKVITYKGVWVTSGQTNYSQLNAYVPIKTGWRFECVGTGCTIDGVEYLAGDFITFNTDVNTLPILTSMIDKTDNTDLVASVNGKKGTVVLDGADINATIEINGVESTETITERLQDFEDFNKFDLSFKAKLENIENTIILVKGLGSSTPVALPLKKTNPAISGQYFYIDRSDGTSETVYFSNEEEYINYHTFPTGNYYWIVISGSPAYLPSLFMNSNPNATLYEKIRLSTHTPYLKDNALAGCFNLKELIGVSGFGPLSLSGCSRLKEIKSLNNSKIISGTIGAGVFDQCRSFDKIELGSSVSSIGNYAFSDCTNLKEITFNRATPPTFGTNIFAGATALSAIYVPLDSVNAYKNAPNFTIYADLIYPIIDGNFLESKFEKLDDIEDGAEVNVIETVKVNNVALTPTEKTVSFTVPTQASDIDALSDTTKYGATVDLTYTALSGELEVTLKDQDGTTLNSKKVDLPLELIITSGTVETCTVIDTPVAGYVVGDKYLDLVLANGGHIYVLVSDLVDQITITETGTGNAVTDISINGSVITETKGKTFVEVVTGYGLSQNDLTDALKTAYDGAVTDKHTHSNKATLDTYTQTETDLASAVSLKHTHNNKELLDTYDQTNVNITDAITNTHTHSNKTILDNTTASYTTTEQSKLSGIAIGAEVNVQSDWNQTINTADDYIKNKPIIPEGVTIVDNLTSTSTTAALSANQGRVLNEIKVDKVEGYELSQNDLNDTLKSNYDTAYTNTHTHSNKTILDNTTAAYTTEEATKLSGIAIGAEVNVQSDWNASSGDAQILNKPTLLELGETSTTAYRGDRGASAYIHSQITGGTNPHATTFANITSKPTTLSGYGITDALPSSTLYGATIDLNYTASTGILGLVLKDQNGTELNSDTVDLPLELLIESGTVETCTVINTPVAGYVVGDKYIDLVLANEAHIYILVSDLIDQITISETGTGNAVTDISINGSVITETKGKTFVETSRTVAGKALSANITLASTDLTDTANIARLAAPTNIGTLEQATAKFMTANGGSLTIGKEGPNSGTMLRFDQVDGTERLRFRSSATAGAMVWSQPEANAALYMDLANSAGVTERITFKASLLNHPVRLKAPTVETTTLTNGTHNYTLPSSTGTLALTSDIPSVSNFLVASNIKAGTNITLSVSGKDVTINSTGGAAVTVVDNLTSTSTTSALSANQGKVLNDTKATKLSIEQWHVPYRDIVGTGEPNTSRLATMTSPLPQAILIRDAEGKATFVGGTSANQGIVKSQLDSAIQSAIYSSWGGEY